MWKQGERGEEFSKKIDGLKSKLEGKVFGHMCFNNVYSVRVVAERNVAVYSVKLIESLRL